MVAAASLRAEQVGLIAGLRPLVITMFLAASVMMIAVPTASAQSEDPSSAAAFRKGPIAFTPMITVPAIGSDANVFNTTDNPKSDYFVNAQPQIELWLRAGRIRLDARQQFNLVYYHTYASERSVNSNSSLRFDAALNRVSPYFTASYVKTTERPTPEVNTRVEFRSRPLAAGALIRLSAKTTLDLAAEHQEMSFEDEATFLETQLKQTLDRSTSMYRGVISYAITPPTSLTFTVAQDESNFEFSPDRDSRSVRVLPGVTLAPFALITGRAEVGWLWFKPVDPIIRPFSGLTARVDIGYVLLGNTRFGLQGSREAMPSIDLISTYFVNTGLTLSITHRFSDRWDGVVSAGSQSLAPGGLVLTESAPDTTDVIETYAAGLGFYFNRGFRLGLRGELTRRFSDRPKSSFENLRLTGSFTYGFQ